MSINNLSLLGLIQSSSALSSNANTQEQLKNIDSSIFTKAIDTNKDGKISAEELQVFLDNPLQAILQSLLGVSLNNSEKPNTVAGTSSKAPAQRISSSGNNAPNLIDTAKTKTVINATNNPVQTITNDDGSKKVIEDRKDYTVETTYDAAGKPILQEKISKNADDAFEIDADNPKVYSKMFFENGVPAKQISEDSNFSRLALYNEDGLISNNTATKKSDGTKLDYNYDYDKNGNQIYNKTVISNSNGDTLKKSEVIKSSDQVQQLSKYTTADGETKEGWVTRPKTELHIQTTTDKETGKNCIIAVKDTNQNSNKSVGFSNRIWQKYDENGKLLKSTVINTNKSGGTKDSLDQIFNDDGDISAFTKRLRESDKDGSYEIKYEYKDGELTATKKYLYKNGKKVDEEAKSLEITSTESGKIIKENTTKSEDNNLLKEAQKEGKSEIAKETFEV